MDLSGTWRPIEGRKKRPNPDRSGLECGFDAKRNDKLAPFGTPRFEGSCKKGFTREGFGNSLRRHPVVAIWPEVLISLDRKCDFALISHECLGLCLNCYRFNSCRLGTFGGTQDDRVLQSEP
ncbi:ribonuclease P [Anopheles sinensis]|uniref:Ribonuclease P n=1 Tax=Anopheles sinensis TaxID=74873 RepID=A0A084VZG2_ANOSI|nr:ribonuclease P [Anopheles sinensis]